MWQLNLLKGREWVRDRQERTRMLINLAGLVIVANLHERPNDFLEWVADRIVADGTSDQHAWRRRLNWARVGDQRFKEWELRGRWENAASTYRKCVIGGILNAAGLSEWPPATVLGALLDYASRTKETKHVELR